MHSAATMSIQGEVGYQVPVRFRQNVLCEADMVGIKTLCGRVTSLPEESSCGNARRGKAGHPGIRLHDEAAL